jgi:nucleoside-diphosphate-sugar epimerase
MDDTPLRGQPVLLTGATGFLGTHLARELVRQGAVVHAIRRDSRSATRLPCEGIAWHQADLLDPTSLRRAVEAATPHVVFHLAATAVAFDAAKDEETYRVNVEGAWNLWQALAGRPCRLVHTGSCGEYGQAVGQVKEDHVCRPTWFYPATKNASVVLLSTLGQCRQREVVVLRPFGPFGPADDPSRVVPQVVQTLLRGEEVQVTAGEQLRDFAYVDDHVLAFLRAATSPLPESGRIYNVGSGDVIRLRDFITLIAEAVGGDAIRRVRFGAIPYRENELWEMSCDISAARAELGYRPRVSLREGLARTVEWYRNEQRSPA